MSLDSVKLNHFACMQNSTEVLCKVSIVITQGLLIFVPCSTYTLTYVTEQLFCLFVDDHPSYTIIL